MPAPKGSKNGLKHGMRYTAQYRCWYHMKDRCNNPKHKSYSTYGGKGIGYHKDFETFEGWWAYIKEKWQEAEKKYAGETLAQDRLDSREDYVPENIQIVSISENTRRRNEEHGNPNPHFSLQITQNVI